MFIHHYVTPILSRSLTLRIVSITTTLLPYVRPDIPQILARIWIIPISVGLSLFLIRARKGYAIHDVACTPIYLPQSFREAIMRIREIQAQGKVESTGISPENTSEEALQLHDYLMYRDDYLMYRDDLPLNQHDNPSVRLHLNRFDRSDTNGWNYTQGLPSIVAAGRSRSSQNQSEVLLISKRRASLSYSPARNSFRLRRFPCQGEKRG